MRKLILIALIALGLLPNIVACEEYDSLDEAIPNIPSSSGSSLSQSGWLYINPTIGFVTTFPKGWSVAVEEGNDTNRKIVFHNGKGAEFILRFKYMPGKSLLDFLAEIGRELLQDCPPECLCYSTTPEPTVIAKEAGLSFDNTIFNAESRTLIDQRIIVIMHEGWGFAFITQATTLVDNKVWNNAEINFNTIVGNFGFDPPTPTPAVCPTCTPTPGG